MRSIHIGLFLLTIIFQLSSFSQTFQITGQKLSATENTYLQQIINDYRRVFPSIMLNAVANKKIELRIQAIGEHKAGQFKNDKIIFNQQLLKNLASVSDPRSTPVDKKYAQNHKSIYDLALASLIHEMSHAYDLMNIQSNEKRSAIGQCEQSISNPMVQGGSRPLTTECLELINIKTTISTQPEVLEAMDYFKAGLFEDRKRIQMNFLEKRSADPYEFKNSIEGFAVNMEYFLLDPEFKCRKPTLYKTLSQWLGNHIPFANVSCGTTNTVIVSGSGEKAVTRFVSLNPDRIHSIDYLFAGKGDAAMSRYGHAMLRIVVCAPNRTQVSDECLSDIHHHLVVSFRASVEDLQIDTMKGIKGDYPSILFILPFVSVIDEYTKKELRELTALPLKLNTLEKNALLNRIIEMQWAYEGKYRFLSNNCADETMNLLKRALPNNQKLQKTGISRPDSMFDALIEIGLADKSKLSNREQAMKMGYFYPSKKVNYDLAMDVLRKQGKISKDKTLEQYLNEEPVQRSVKIDQLLETDLKGDNQKALAAYLMLEDLALAQVKSQFYKETIEEVMAVVQKNKKSSSDHRQINESEIQDIQKDMKTMRELVKLFRSPSYLLSNDTRYGVPMQNEVDEILKNDEILSNAKKAEEIAKGNEQKLKTFSKKETLLKLEKTSENFKKLIVGLSRK